MAEDDLPKPTTVYGASKVAGEHLLRVAGHENGLAWTVGRLFFIYGPKQYAEGGYKSVIVKNFERIRSAENPVVFGDGKQALDYVYVDDCVEALLAMLAPEHDGRTYNVSISVFYDPAEMSQAGWPEGAPGRNALDVHVLRLRRRLAPLSLVIRTVRSRGYLLEALSAGQVTGSVS